MPRILVVDDDLSMREFLELMLTREGYEVSLAPSGQAALDMAGETPFDLVITDIRMKHIDGLEVLKQIKSMNPETVVILISAFATAETAVIAMNEGAFDFFPKPFQVEELKAVISRALALGTVEAERLAIRENIEEERYFGSLVGLSPQMTRVYDIVRRAARTLTNILITGESGTGKELVAKAIHENSPRADEKFVTINCGGMPEQLVESELFGHRKGAFTGATVDKPGLFEIASKGTIFLDEIGELSIPMQVKLLRVVQEKTYRAVGGTEERSVDVRFISATNKDLEDEVLAGRFREDLFYRLNVIQIRMPPLRERQGDLPLLANFFLEKYSREMGKDVWKISSYALDILSQYDFPGNVRELENIIQRSVALEQSNIILPESLTLGSFKRRVHLDDDTTRTARQLEETREDAPAVSAAASRGLDEILAYLETRLLLLAMRAAEGDRTAAAELLRTNTRSLRYRMSKYGLDTLTLSEMEKRCEQVEARTASRPYGPENPQWVPGGLNLEEALNQVEKYLIDKALEEAEGNKTRAAELLGVSFRSLRYRLSRNNLDENE